MPPLWSNADGCGSAAQTYRDIWINFRLDVFGNTYTMYREGNVFLTWVDNTGPVGPQNGTIGFWTAYNQYTYFERLRVRGSKRWCLLRGALSIHMRVSVILGFW